MPFICAAALLAAAGPHAQTPAARITSALEMYERGDVAPALKSRPLDGIEVSVVLDALSTIAPERRHAAIRFVIDAIASSPVDQMWYGVPYNDGAPVGSRLRIGGPGDGQVQRPWSPRFPDQGAILPLVSWACDLMPKTGPAEPWERWWWLTSIAILQQAGEWGALVGNDNVEYRGTPPQPWETRARQEAKIGGHLAHARKRIADDPRLHLAQVVSRAAPVTDASARFTIGPATRLLRQNGRFDVIRNLEQTVSTVNSGLFVELERDFVALLGEPGLEGEVSLRIAQLRLLRKDWREAHQWLHRASEATNDPTLLATTDYFRGWVFERTDHPADALAAYRRAYGRTSQSPNLNSLYAAQLLLAGERAEAARVLDALMRSGSANLGSDLWHVLVSGDARMAASLAIKMREAR